MSQHSEATHILAPICADTKQPELSEQVMERSVTVNRSNENANIEENTYTIQF